jgi:Domain of unknown function (DUF4832)/Domain of unknown function (DUF4874)
MKHLQQFLGLTLALLCLGACSQVNTEGLEPQVITTYQASSKTFPNPERGFAYENDVAWPNAVTWGFCGQGNNYTAYTYTAWNTPLDLGFLREERNQGRSVVMSRYHLADFRERDLTPKYLAFLQKDFDTLRQAGLKMIIRFAYNYPMGGPDASLARILRHLEQLKPLLQKNVDVIAFVEAGLVGCWGEWHHSSNGLDLPDDAGISSAETQIINKWLEVLPRERMIAFRYPRQKFDYAGNADLAPVAPLTAQTAFTGTKRSRLAHHDDCFVCNETHGGSYWNPRGDFSEIPTFLAKENLFVAQGGEPGDPEALDPSQPGNVNSPLSSCTTVTTLFRRQHWSTVGLYNLGADISATKRWQRDGCWTTFNQKLGYRFELVSSSAPTSVSKTKNLVISFGVKNVGFASPYNPRKLELILLNKTTKQVFRIVLNNGALGVSNQTYDPRFWQPNTTTKVTVNAPLPSTLPTGSYDLLLNLPDPKNTLSKRPEYSIRLANQNVWEPTTGYNSLLRSITVNP